MKLVQALLHPRRAASVLRDRALTRAVTRIPNYQRIDLVDFGDVACFMFEDDNLYRNYVPGALKHLGPADFAQRLDEASIDARVPTLEAARTSTDARLVLHALLAHCWDAGASASFVDVGAHTGLVGLRLARFAERVGADLRVSLHEPGSMSELCARNIEVNRLGDLVSHDPRAAGTYDGVAVFSLPIGSSDGDRMTDSPVMATSRLVSVARLSRLLDETPGDVVIVKLDTEGLEPQLLRESAAVRRARSVALVFEFMPWRYDAGEAEQVLRTLSADHWVFDIGYAPNPWVVSEVVTDRIGHFVEEIRVRPFGYTDILAVPHALPRSNELCARLGSFRTRPPSLSLS